MKIRFLIFGMVLCQFAALVPLPAHADGSASATIALIVPERNASTIQEDRNHHLVTIPHALPNASAPRDAFAGPGKLSTMPAGAVKVWVHL